jgi:hypothetical protein
MNLSFFIFCRKSFEVIYIILGLLNLILHILSIFENRVLRRIFGPRRDEVMGGWRKLHNEELHDL